MKNLSARLPLSRLSLGLSLCFAAANASAGTMGPAETELWAGAYFGVHAGSGAGKIDQSLSDSTNSINNTQYTNGTTILSSTRNTGYANLHGDVTGSLAHLFIGYNFHRPGSSFVYGGQLEGTLFSDVALKGGGIRDFRQTITNKSILGTVTTTTATGYATYEQLGELRSTFNVIARGGYLVRENTMLYALGGVVEGHFVVLDTQNSDNEKLVGGKRNQWETGGAVGCGAEYKFNEHLSFLAEYRFMWFNYGRSQSTDSINTSVTTTSITVKQDNFNNTISNDFNYNLGQIGIVYRV